MKNATALAEIVLANGRARGPGERSVEVIHSFVAHSINLVTGLPLSRTSWPFDGVLMLMESKRTFQRALDLIARIESAPDVVTLNAWFLDVASEFGVESFDVLLLGRRVSH